MMVNSNFCGKYWSKRQLWNQPPDGCSRPWENWIMMMIVSNVSIFWNTKLIMEYVKTPSRVENFNYKATRCRVWLYKGLIDEDDLWNGLTLTKIDPYGACVVRPVRELTTHWFWNRKIKPSDNRPGAGKILFENINIENSQTKVRWRWDREGEC